MLVYQRVGARNNSKNFGAIKNPSETHLLSLKEFSDGVGRYEQLPGPLAIHSHMGILIKGVKGAM